MRKLFSFILLALFVATANATPAMRGIWRTITLQNGTAVEAELCGDEFLHYWRATDGQLYFVNNDVARVTTVAEVETMYAERRTKFMNVSSNSRLARQKAQGKKQAPLLGSKKGLIILVDFADKKFSMSNPKEYFNSLANATTAEGYNGSVATYFSSQSDGKFLLNFDIVGPISMSQPYSYYGGDNDVTNDVNVGVMVCQAITAASAEVNWKDYDWNEDNEVEQVYFIYAGEGQATGGGDDTIWPHKYYVSAHSYAGMKPMVVDGVTIDVYACSNEMRTSTKVAGIGTICHEFSHCLGFPDFYDTTVNSGASKTQYGMGTWDLMNSGSHNANGYCPPNFTCWEKMIAGWVEPVEIKSDYQVKNLKATQHGGGSFIVYNEANRNEYLMVENRQREGWDEYIASSGLLVMHVDYDQRIFDYYNAPNTLRPGVNDHQRMTIYHADNTESDVTESTDPYPYNWNNLLSANSVPSIIAYNKKDGHSNLLDVKISRITDNGDKTVSFYFGNPAKSSAEVLFAESFDDCVGTGANDGRWLTLKTATGTFTPDNEGWMGNYMKGGFLCARIGQTAADATLVTPEITFNGDSEMYMKLAAFNATAKSLTITSDNPAIKVNTSDINLTSGAWAEQTISITGEGKAKLSFVPNGPFYIDDIIITDKNATGIAKPEITEETSDCNMYSVSGQRVDSSYKGIVIQNGKKIFKR